MFEFQYAGDSYHGCSSRRPKENRLNIFNWSLKHCWMEQTLLRMIWLNQQIHRRWKTFPEDHSRSYDWIIRLWLYVFWDGFYTRKMSFSSNWMNPQFPLTVCCCSVTKWSDNGSRDVKGMKNTFLRPHTMRSTARAKGADISSPLRSAWLKKDCFLILPNILFSYPGQLNRSPCQSLID